MKNQPIVLTSIMTIVTFLAVGVAVILLYFSELEERKNRLSEIVKSNAAMISAVAKFDASHNEHNHDHSIYHPDPRSDTIKQIVNASKNFSMKGDVEFTIGEVKDNHIHWIVRHKYKHTEEVWDTPTVELGSHLAQPMQLALQDKMGIIKGIDYAGNTVIAAYAPVRCLKIGLVAKTQLDTIFYQYAKNALTALVFAIIIVIIGVIIFTRKVNPITTAIINKEAFLNKIINESPFATWVSDEKGLLIKCNIALKRILNLTDEQLVGKYNIFEDKIAEEQGIMPIIKEVYNEGKTCNFSLEWDGKDLGYKDSNKAHIEGTMFPIHDDKGTLTNVVNHWIDVTERKKVEKDLRDSEAKSRSWIDNSPSCTKVIDLDFNLQYMSEAGFRMLKLEGTDADVYEKPYPFYFFPESFKGKMIECMERVKTTGEVITLEDTMNDIKGNKAWLYSTLIPVKDEEGRVEYLMVVSDDVTERIKAVEERDKLESKLVHNQKMEALGALAGNIAHDFNNILVPISSYSELIVTLTDDKSEIHDFATKIYNSSLTATEITKQVLSFTKVDDDIVEKINMVDVVKETYELMKGSISANIEMSLKIKNETNMIIQANASKIKQIIINLLTNSYQAIGQNPGKIIINLENINTTKSQYPDVEVGNYIKLSICDNGPGMTKETMSRMFEPFYTTRKKEKGTGLGLSIIHGIVKSYKGFINVYSEVNEGTAFHVGFKKSNNEPLVQEDNHIEINTSNKPDISILLVDDQKEVSEATEALLKNIGYQNITSINDSEEALQLFIKDPNKFDLVITDLTMPKLSGKKLSMKIKEMRSDIPIILYSGFNEDINGFNSVSIGVQKYLTKPISIKDLTQAINELIKESPVKD